MKLKSPSLIAALLAVMKSPCPRRYGFTLVELLVVIVIVATLAAIGFTLALRMKSSANQAITTANLRQIGVAMASYTSDTGRFPSRTGDPVWDRAIMANLGYDQPTGPNGNLIRSVHPTLVSTAKTFTTPQDKERRDPAIYARSFAIVPWTTNWSNGTLFRGWKDRPLNIGIPLTILDAPERAAMVVQGHHGLDANSPPNYLGASNWCYKDMGGPPKLLGATQQVLFADGHIERISNKMTTDEFVKQYWPGTIGTLD